MLYHLKDLIIKTRQHIGESEEHTITPNDTAVGYVYDAIDYVCAKIIGFDELFFTAYYDISLDGSLDYDMPLGVRRVAFVQDISAGATNPLDTEPIDFINRYQFVTAYSNLTSLNYYFENGKIGIPTKESGITARVYYPAIPKKVFYMDVDSTSSTTVTLTSEPEDVNGAGKIIRTANHYKGMYLVDESGEYHEVISNTAGGVFTTAAWTTSPTVVSLAPPVDPRFQQLLHLEAGILWKIDLDDSIVELQRRVDSLWEQFELLAVDNVTHRSKEIEHIRRG